MTKSLDSTNQTVQIKNHYTNTPEDETSSLGLKQIKFTSNDPDRPFATRQVSESHASSPTDFQKKNNHKLNRAGTFYQGIPSNIAACNEGIPISRKDSPHRTQSIKMETSVSTNSLQKNNHELNRAGTFYQGIPSNIAACNEGIPISRKDSPHRTQSIKMETSVSTNSLQKNNHELNRVGTFYQGIPLNIAACNEGIPISRAELIFPQLEKKLNSYKDSPHRTQSIKMETSVSTNSLQKNNHELNRVGTFYQGIPLNIAACNKGIPISRAELIFPQLEKKLNSYKDSPHRTQSIKMETSVSTSSLQKNNHKLNRAGTFFEGIPTKKVERLLSRQSSYSNTAEGQRIPGTESGYESGSQPASLNDLAPSSPTPAEHVTYPKSTQSVKRSPFIQTMLTTDTTEKEKKILRANSERFESGYNPLAGGTRILPKTEAKETHSDNPPPLPSSEPPNSNTAEGKAMLDFLNAPDAPYPDVRDEINFSEIMVLYNEKLRPKDFIAQTRSTCEKIAPSESTLSKDDEYEVMIKKLEYSRKKIFAAENKLSKLKNELKEYNDDNRIRDIEYQEIKADLLIKKEAEPDIIKHLNIHYSNPEHEIEKLNTRIKHLEDSIKKLSTDSAKEENEIDEYNQWIEKFKSSTEEFNIGFSKEGIIRELNIEIETLKKKIEKFRDNSSKAKNEIDVLKTTIKKLEYIKTSMEALDKDYDETEVKIEELEITIKKLEADIREYKLEYDGYRKRKNKLEIED
ncbi:hypothetical protein [Candidatus Regiella endosymbiont of Tuberolachnus salignus]|uniref:hypothetical protein n=1 Tax=Candidatus Regiella endosymbiont of Tuberolachnus salignus TaxID=3077956 RepID=UPI0030D53146